MICQGVKMNALKSLVVVLAFGIATVVPESVQQPIEHLDCLRQYFLEKDAFFRELCRHEVFRH